MNSGFEATIISGEPWVPLYVEITEIKFSCSAYWY